MAEARTPEAAAGGAALAPAVPAATKPKSTEHLLLLQMLAGSGAGALTKTATAPLERIKIIFQIQVCLK